MKYERAFDLEEKIKDIVNTLEIRHINLNRIACFRSYGTNSKRVIARCHGLPKIMQLGMGIEAFYVIEVIEERFSKMGEEERTKVLIHELLHIPKSFGGGFRHHDYVNRRTVDRLYSEYKLRKERDNFEKNNLNDPMEKINKLEIERIKMISKGDERVENYNDEERKDWLFEKLNKFFTNKKEKEENKNLK
ncbi:MAG: putative metallopeptidase [Candidatus Micrarchaeota archaeon]|nr:putative metallopeptidase [Candidatus Micrarchaeota archaeon]